MPHDFVPTGKYFMEAVVYTVSIGGAKFDPATIVDLVKVEGFNAYNYDDTKGHSFHYGPLTAPEVAERINELMSITTMSSFNIVTHGDIVQRAKAA